MDFSSFICPVCSQPLTPQTQALRCPQGHSFNIARQGYVSLVTGGSHISGDKPPMVAARSSFLARGLYEPVAQALSEALTQRDDDLAGSRQPGLSVQTSNQPEVGPRPANPSSAHPLMADLGGGTGHYSSYVLDSHPHWHGVLLDVSKAAAKLAARAHPRLTAATADLRATIPLASGSADLAMVVFAPRQPVEIARILTPAGRCLVVTPTDRHLAELREAVPLLGIDPHKEDRLLGQFSAFSLSSQRLIEYSRAFSHDALTEVIAMGPNAFHSGLSDAVSLPESMTVTISVNLHVFSKGGRHCLIDHPTDSAD